MRKILMTKPHILASLILLAVFTAACAPATSTVAPAQPGVVEPTATSAAVSPDTSAQTPATAEPTALPVATSRGPELHATDPATVSLASGQLQLVEFFRF